LLALYHAPCLLGTVHVLLKLLSRVLFHLWLVAVIRHHYPELLHTREHPSSSTGSNNSNGSGEAVASQQEAAQPSTSAGMDNKSAADASAAGGNVYVELLREVCRRTGVLVALWQVGALLCCK
jgi:uncharacterized protein YdiU (UPF0061 family)